MLKKIKRLEWNFNNNVYACLGARNSQPKVLCKKGVFRNFAKFTGKHLYQNLYFNRVAGIRPGILFKKRLWYRSFRVNFVKFLGIPFLQNTTGRLLLRCVSLTWSKKDNYLHAVRSSCAKVLCKKGVFKNFAKFTGKQLCRILCYHTKNILKTGSSRLIQLRKK